MASSMMSCPYCGKLTDPRLDNCVHCGGFLRKKPGPGQRRSSGEKETCPTCGALVQAGDIICVACGTNLLTGQRITEEQAAAAKPAKRKLKLPSIDVNLKWVAVGTLGFLVMVIVLLLLAWFFSRDPVQIAIEQYNRGHIIEAVETLEDYLHAVPDSVEGHQALAWIHWENANYAVAAEQLASVVRLAPGRRDAHLGLALSWASTRDPGNRRRAIAALEEMVTRFPGDEQAWYLLGLLRGIEGDFDAQAEALREVAATDGARALSARRLLAISSALRGYTSAAQRAIQEIVAYAPNDGDVLATAALIASEEADWIAATEYLRAAVDSGTGFDDEALTHLGILLVSRGRFSEAKGYLGRAKALDETNRRAQLFHAVCQRELGLYEEAMRELDPLVRTTGPLAAQAAVEMARVHLVLNDPVRAMQSVQQAIDLGATGATVHTLQGRAHARAGEHAAARDAFRRAMQADAEYAPAYLEFGLYFLQQGAMSDAIEQFERYLGLIDPDIDDAHADEVRTLVAQLKETVGAAQGAT